nr:alpha/beta hydrolase [Pedobacter panaciterrae]
MKKLEYIKKIAIVAACSLLIWGMPASSQDKNIETAHAAPAITVMKDQQYGTDLMQGMDIYLLPNRDKNTPLVILVHGGGWMAGDKKDADFMKDFMLNKGFNVININYRLGNQTNIHYREIIGDMDKAIQYTVAHAKKWNIRKSKYIFWGGSAGGHLSLLYAYRYDPKNRISAVISLGGPTRLDDNGMIEGAKKEDLEGLLPIITGSKWNPGALSPDYQNASPYYSKKFIPSMLVHGEKDTIVPSSQAKVMADKLKQEGIDYQLIVLPNAGHGGEGSPEENAIDLQKRMVDWVIKYSK